MGEFFFKEDPWDLFVQGQWQRALDIFDNRYQEGLGVGNLFNRGLIFLNVKNYPAALQEFDKILSVERPNLLSTGNYFFLGICYWYLGKLDTATELWQASLTAPYVDAAGGVEAPALLLYAAIRLDNAKLRQQAISELRKFNRRKLRAWPGAIVPFLLEKIDEKEFESLATSKVAKIAIRHRCQADFYVALKALSKGDIQQFRDKMESCARSEYGYLEHEYYLAKWEVDNNFPVSLKLLNVQAKEGGNREIDDENSITVLQNFSNSIVHQNPSFSIKKVSSTQSV